MTLEHQIVCVAEQLRVVAAFHELAENAVVRREGVPAEIHGYSVPSGSAQTSVLLTVGPIGLNHTATARV